jgi:hypothetical protein
MPAQFNPAARVPPLDCPILPGLKRLSAFSLEKVQKKRIIITDTIEGQTVYG